MKFNRYLDLPGGPRSPWLLLVLCLAALALAGCGGGSGGSVALGAGSRESIASQTALGGRVVDNGGNPVPGALVELLPGVVPRAKAGEPVALSGAWQTQTDPNGDYFLSGFPPGFYELRVTAPGQTPWLLALELVSGIYLTQDVRFWTPLPGQGVAAFSSYATDLVAGDVDDGFTDIFLSFEDGTVQKITELPPGATGGNSSFPVLSDSQRFLVFQSMAQLVPEDQNASVDVYRFDRQTGVMTCLTAAVDFHFGYCDTGQTNPYTAGDGRFTVFEWNTGDSEDKRIFLHDADSGLLAMISVGLGPDGLPNACCKRPVISADGRWVAFDSAATNLVEGQDPTDENRNIFVYDRLTGTLTQASWGPPGTSSTDCSQWASISADGRFVAFRSNSDILLQPPPLVIPPNENIYVRDMLLGETQLVSRDSGGTPSWEPCYRPCLSGDGRIVAFSTGAALVAEDSNSNEDVYLRDLQAGTTQLVSWNAGMNNGGNSHSSVPVVSFDGSHILFQSYSTDLVAGGLATSVMQVYMRDLGSAVNYLLSHTPSMEPGNDASYTRE